MGMVYLRRSLAFRPSAASKRRRGRFPRSWDGEELDDPCVESLRKLLKNANRWVFEAALQSADIGTVDPGIHRQVLLRQAAPNSQPSEIPRDERLRPHPCRPAGCGPSNHGLWSYHTGAVVLAYT